MLGRGINVHRRAPRRVIPTNSPPGVEVGALALMLRLVDSLSEYQDAAKIIYNMSTQMLAHVGAEGRAR
eukprot:4800314-Pleurochrysis_carterae.AAC.1